MKFRPELRRGVLLRRYKRFLADVELDGRTETVHCPNTGRMTNCVVEGAPCWLLEHQNAKRKYPLGWEIATTTTGHLAGINTMRANALVAEAIATGVVAPLQHYHEIASEVRLGKASRLDFKLSSASESCFVEVKSVTLGFADGLGCFPDAPSERAVRHLRELRSLLRSGHRAVLFFCVQHSGITQVSPADDIDPKYGETMRLALEEGLEVLAYKANISATEISLQSPLPVVVDDAVVNRRLLRSHHPVR